MLSSNKNKTIAFLSDSVFFQIRFFLSLPYEQFTWGYYFEENKMDKHRKRL